MRMNIRAICMNQSNSWRRRAYPLLVAFSLIASGGLIANLTPPQAIAQPVDSPQGDPEDGAVTLGVSPPRLEVEIDPQGTTGAFRTYNLGTRTVTVQTSLATWQLDERNQIELVEPTEQTLDQWLLLSPSTFTIPPGEEQVVRFSIRPRVQPNPGEHRAMIFLDPIVEDSGEGITTAARLGVTVYGNVGDVVRRGTLHDITIRPSTSNQVGEFEVELDFDIASEGLNHIRMDGQYSIWHADQYPGTEATSLIPISDDTELPDGTVFVGYLPNTPVLPATRRTLSTLVPQSLEKGNYVLDIEGFLGEEEIEREMPFTVGP